MRGLPSLRAGGHVVVPRIGLQFSRRLTFEAWVGIGRQLSAVVASSAWCLGDWLVYGQEVYESRYRTRWSGRAWITRRCGITRG